jgi:hypothetical protein
MAKTKTILVSEVAYQAVSRAAMRAGKSISSMASDIIIGAKSEAELEQMSIRNKIAEMEDKMNKLASRKDLAALFYSLSKGPSTDVRKERLALGYRMLLGHEIHVDFASVDVEKRQSAE